MNTITHGYNRCPTCGEYLNAAAPSHVCRYPYGKPVQGQVTTFPPPTVEQRLADLERRVAELERVTQSLR
jgi:hypothetical protein